MSGSDSQSQADARKARLAQELRANLARRKQQARSRRQGEADHRPDGLQPAATDKRPDDRD